MCESLWKIWLTLLWYTRHICHITSLSWTDYAPPIYRRSCMDVNFSFLRNLHCVLGTELLGIFVYFHNASAIYSSRVGPIISLICYGIAICIFMKLGIGMIFISVLVRSKFLRTRIGWNQVTDTDDTLVILCLCDGCYRAGLYTKNSSCQP